VVFIIASSLLKLSKAWFVIAEAEKKVSLMQKMQTETELKALKAQINPHFLFNSLNSIHALALKSSAKTKDVVIQLSDMLRYMLYETDVEFVSMKKEIRFIQNYIAVQSVRLDSELDIDMQLIGEPENHEIAPLLLLPLIENAFKHGNKNTNDDSFIKINLIVRDAIIFEISNRKDERESIETENCGLGIQNVKKRLELIYPGKHELNIMDVGTKFTVYLKIEN